jgi:hypothetical protein
MTLEIIQRQRCVFALLFLAVPLFVRADAGWLEEVALTNLPSRSIAQGECKSDEYYNGYAEGYLQANSMRGQAELVTDNVRYPGLSPFLVKMLDPNASASSVGGVLGSLHESTDTLCARALKPYLEVTTDKKARFKSGGFSKALKNYNCCRSGYQDARERVLARLNEPNAQTCAKVYNSAIKLGIEACYGEEPTISRTQSIWAYFVPSACAVNSLQSCSAPLADLNPMFDFDYKAKLKILSQTSKEWFDSSLASDTFSGLKPELRSCFTWGIGQARLKCKETADNLGQAGPEIATFIAPASKSQQSVQQSAPAAQQVPTSSGQSGE